MRNFVVGFLISTLTVVGATALSQVPGHGADGIFESASLGGTATDDIDMGGNLVHDTTGPLELGTSASSTYGWGAGDVMMGGDLEVDGKAYFDGQVRIANGLYVRDDINLIFGSSNDMTLAYRTGNTPDSFIIGLATQSRTMVIGEQGDGAFDYAHAQATDPTVAIHSSNQSTTEYIALSHNQTSGVIHSGAGGVTISNGGFVPPKVTSDPCGGANYPEGSIFYNDTSNYWCGCDGTNDIKLSDGAACF